MKSLNILILSSRPIEWSANLGKDYVNALEGRGHHVDFNFPGMQEIIVDKRNRIQSIRSNLIFKLLYHTKILSVLHKLGLFFHVERLLPFSRNGYQVINGSENEPLLDPFVIINNLPNKSYDIIITLFWENVISSYTLKILHECYHCPILINSIDMAPMTGGCFYFGSCRNFNSHQQCRKCPAVGGLLNSFTHKNYLNKINNYKDIDVVYSCNSYVNAFVQQSGLFKRVVVNSIIINNKYFHPIDRKICINRWGIPNCKTFILLFRFSTEKRKGFSYIKDAIACFLNRINKSEHNRILLLTVGEKCNDREFLEMVDVMQLGFVGINDLALAYNSASVFVNPSIDDAGPSMVNQAIMCGTPVVSFDSGTAQDVVVDGISGYKAPVKDSSSLGDKIFDIYNMIDDIYRNLRQSTLDLAIQWNDGSKFVESVEDVYLNYQLKEFIIENNK